ncbi:MAG: DUF2098 domain-containing protein [Euryarchaeota archaeon]
MALKVGDYARYVRTGTVGKIVDVKEEGGRRWYKLDSTGLYYREDQLERAERVERKERQEDVQDVLKKIKELEEAFSEATGDHVCEGG